MYDFMLQKANESFASNVFCVDVSNAETATQDLFEAYKALKDDRPELYFWGREVHVQLCGNRLTVCVQLLYSKDEILRINRLLEYMIRRLLRGTLELNEWEAELLIYGRMATWFTYSDRDEEFAYDIVGPLLLKRGVCEGIVGLLILALRRAGLPAVKVTGIGQNERHCWVMTWVNGIPYHLDVTWDLADSLNELGFFYFNLTDEEICKDHLIYTKGLPKCLNSYYGYHRYCNSKCKNVYEAKRFIATEFRAGKNVVRFRLENGSVKELFRKPIRCGYGEGYYYKYSENKNSAVVFRMRNI